MLFRMLYDDKLAAASYLIGCQKTGQAIVIDPMRDIEQYLDLAAREGLRIVAVTETHIHADYLSGARELAQRTGAKVYLSDEGDADWKYQWLNQKNGGGNGGGAYDHQLLHHGDTFRIGNIEFKTLHTPGHTPEHICFTVTDRGAGATEPMGIASGDFLFVGDLGRPDLLETAAGIKGQADASARRLYQTIRSVSALPDFLQVWPAHGAGSACGKALGAVPQSTLGYERRFNAALQAASSSEDDFLRFILEGQPEPPLYFARMKRDNKAGPRLLNALPKPKPLSLDDLKQLDTRRIALIDTRPWAAFRTGHIPGSLFHPVNQSFPTDVGSMVAEHEPIYLIIEPSKVDEAVRDLIHVGLDDIRGYFEPSIVEAFAKSGGILKRTPELTIAEARAKLPPASSPTRPETFVLDVRRAAEFAEGHIASAHNISHTRLLSRLSEVPRDRPILVNCRSGARSARACALLQKNGFTDVSNLASGYLAWEKETQPAAHATAQS